jgi:aminomethyltransferase
VAEELKHSPLEAEHERLGARLVPFAGWLMPVHYSSILDEHQAVRTGAGVFDISHMGQLVVSGPGAREWLDRMLTNNVAALGVGEGQYTLLLNERGGVIDDLIIYRTDRQAFFLVVNAAMTAEDDAWLRRHLPTAGVTVEDKSAGLAGMAVQGPRAAALLDHLPPRNGVKVGGSVILCRTGYTGEDGFELFCPNEAAAAWFRRFLEAGARPCGLGARDTLRLEMCYPLNGSDLGPERTPLEAGLGIFVDLGKAEFVGHEALRAQKLAEDYDRLSAILMKQKGPPPRAHYAVLSEGGKVSELTSGGIAPSMGGAGIALAYLPRRIARPGTSVEIDIRGKAHAAEVVKKPFHKKRAA